MYSFFLSFFLSFFFFFFFFLTSILSSSFSFKSLPFPLINLYLILLPLTLSLSYRCSYTHFPLLFFCFIYFFSKSTKSSFTTFVKSAVEKKKSSASLRPEPTSRCIKTIHTRDHYRTLTPNWGSADFFSIATFPSGKISLSLSLSLSLSHTHTHTHTHTNTHKYAPTYIHTHRSIHTLTQIRIKALRNIDEL